MTTGSGLFAFFFPSPPPTPFPLSLSLRPQKSPFITSCCFSTIATGVLHPFHRAPTRPTDSFYVGCDPPKYTWFGCRDPHVGNLCFTISTFVACPPPFLIASHLSFPSFLFFRPLDDPAWTSSAVAWTSWPRGRPSSTWRWTTRRGTATCR